MGRLAVLLLALLAGAAAMTPVADSDIWWHLAAGREMISRRGLLWVDPFSLGARGRPWIDLHWLFQLGSYALHRLGGLAALVAAKVILVGGGALIWSFAVEAAITTGPPGAGGAERRTRLLARALLALLLPLGLLSVRHLLLVRPVLLTLIFCAAFTLILERFATRGHTRALWCLPPLTVVWANCQGLWPLGLLLLACTLGGDLLARLWRRRELPAGGAARLWLILILSLVAGLITPYGWRGLILPLRLLFRLVPADANVFSSQVAENVPPWLLARGDPLLLLPLLLLLLLIAASFLVAPRDRIIGRTLTVLAFIALGLSANRNLLLLVWMGIPLAVANAALALAQARFLCRWPAPAGPGRFIPGAAWGAAMAALASLLLVAIQRETALDEPTPFRVPAESARLIGEAPGRGRIFAADHYGGYLIWALYPRASPYLDTRLVLRTAAEYGEFLDLLDDPQRWDPFARRHVFDYVTLPTDFPDRYLPLTAHLYRATDWRLIYSDGTESLFRHDPRGPSGLDLGQRATTRQILVEQARRYGLQGDVADAARRQLARLQLALGHPEESLHVLSPLTGEDSPAQVLAARCHLQLGDVSAAEAIAGRLVEDGRELVTGFNLLALAALRRGEVPASLKWLRKALSEDPFDLEARAILDQAEEQLARPDVVPRKD
jgi:hypothetical protein